MSKNELDIEALFRVFVHCVPLVHFVDKFVEFLQVSKCINAMLLLPFPLLKIYRNTCFKHTFLSFQYIRRQLLANAMLFVPH